MSRRALLAVLAATLLVLAGCQSTASEPPEVTPVPVPTTTETGGEGIPTAHREALDGTTYTTRVTYRLEYADGTTARLTEQFIPGTGERYLYERRRVGSYPGSPTNVTIWQNGATGFVRRAGTNETDVIRSSTGTVLQDTTLSGLLRRLLSGFNLTPSHVGDTRTLTDSRTVIRTVPLPPGVHDARNATVEVLIRDDVVRSVRIDCVADRGPADEPVRVGIRFETDGIGDPEPTPPEWTRRSR